MQQKKPNWNLAPLTAEAGLSRSDQNQNVWFKKDSEGLVWKFCQDRAWIFMDGLKRFPPDAELRPNPKHVHELTIGPWDGEGLPPVGTVCEAINHRVNRVEVTIRYVGEERVIAHDGNNERCFLIKDTDFHRIRTPEQIELEEREKQIRDMLEIRLSTTSSDFFTALWFAGYRKQVAP